MINGREGTAEEDTSTTTNNDTRKQRIRILGVCGGIGSGKSTVCQVLVSEFGCLGHIGKKYENYFVAVTHYSFSILVAVLSSLSESFAFLLCIYHVLVIIVIIPCTIRSG